MMLDDFHVRSTLVIRIFWAQLKMLFFPWLVGLLAGTAAMHLLPANRLRLIRRLRTVEAVLLGAMLGTVSPFPVLAVTGLVTSLAAGGFPIPALFAFLVASPLLDPTMFTFTLLSLGTKMAIARLAAAVIAGCLAGALAALLQRRGHTVGLLAGEGVSASWEPQIPAASGPSVTGGWRSWGKTFHGQFSYAVRYFLLATIVTAWITVYVPRSWITGLLGPGSRFAIPGAVLLGVPAYSCGGGAIAMMAGLTEQGMSCGAALAFLTFGPATTLRTLSGLASVLNWRGVVLFLLVALSTALIFGYGYALIGYWR
ncbi:MAG: permease [Chloroflexota bacterium]